jgi:hypothetical protein
MGVPTYADVTGSARALLDDLAVSGGAIYDDTFLQPFVQLAQNTLVAQLVSGSVQQMLFRTELLVPAGTLFLSYSFDPLPSFPALPSTLVIPDQLWESVASTNLVSPNDFAFTPWTNDSTVNPTVTAGQGDPRGGTSATKWAYAGVATHRARQITTTPILLGQLSTVSFWLKATTPGNVTVKNPIVGGADQVVAATVDWQHFTVSFGPMTSGALVSQQVWLDFGGAINDYYLYGMELGTGQRPNEDFFPMSGPTEIPRIAQTDRIKFWNFTGDRLYFLGATQDRIVRIDFWGDLAAVSVSTPTARIRIINGGNALAALVASMASRSRGQHQIANGLATFERDGSIGGMAGVEINAIINAETKAQQAEPVRRRPYFGRDRYSSADYFIRGRF